MLSGVILPKSLQELTFKIPESVVSYPKMLECFYQLRVTSLFYIITAMLINKTNSQTKNIKFTSDLCF